VTNSKSGDKSDKDFAAMPRDQQFLELVRRKLRKANKKMKRITALEASTGDKKVVDVEQKKLLASKEVTSTLVFEFTELQTQMTKLLEEKKEAPTTPVDTPASDNKEKVPRKERKRKEKAPVADSTSTSQESTSTSTQEGTSTTSSQGANTQAVTSQGSSSNQSGAPQGQAQGQREDRDRGDRPPKAKKAWVVQKEIYMSQFKPTFTEDMNGKFVGVSKGKLMGPYNTSEELQQATAEDKDCYFAVIGGDERQNPLRRPSSGRRERGDRSDNGPRDGSSNRGRDQRGPRRGDGGFNNQRRGGPRGNEGQGTSSPSQGRSYDN